MASEIEIKDAILTARDMPKLIASFYWLDQWTKEKLTKLSDMILYLTVPKEAHTYHEDIGPVMWWSFPVQEEPYVGTPFDLDFDPNVYTHWTPIVMIEGIK